jgi:hypothetical protein
MDPCPGVGKRSINEGLAKNIAQPGIGDAAVERVRAIGQRSV